MPPVICSKTALSRITLKLRIYREASGMSQRDTANVLNVGHRSYQRIESGEAICDIDFLYRFSNLFNINFDSLVSPNPPEIKSGLELFSEGVGCEAFRRILSKKDLDLYDVDRLINTEKVSFENVLNDNNFLNAKNTLKACNPFTITLNNSTAKVFGFKNKKIIKNIYYSNVYEEGNYWDCVYYYKPSHSIRNNAIIEINEMKGEFNIYSSYVYMKDGVFSVSLLVPTGKILKVEAS